MTDLTKEQAAILRRILGLTSRNRNAPTRNHSGGIDNDAHAFDIAALLAKRYVYSKTLHGTGPRVREVIYMATDAGRDAVLEQSWSE